MDGYHLAQSELQRLGRAERKGAPDTFDAAGYVALLRRLRNTDAGTVYAPEFRRAIEEPIAAAVPVPTGLPLVVTEGNYLLLDAPPWSAVRGLGDVGWVLAPAGRLQGRRQGQLRVLAGEVDEALAHAAGGAVDGDGRFHGGASMVG